MSLYVNLEANTFSMDSPLKYKSVSTKDEIIDGKEKISNSLPVSTENIEVSVASKAVVDITSAQRRGSVVPNKAQAGANKKVEKSPTILDLQPFRRMDKMHKNTVISCFTTFEYNKKVWIAMGTKKEKSIYLRKYSNLDYKLDSSTLEVVCDNKDLENMTGILSISSFSNGNDTYLIISGYLFKDQTQTWSLLVWKLPTIIESSPVKCTSAMSQTFDSEILSVVVKMFPCTIKSKHSKKNQKQFSEPSDGYKPVIICGGKDNIVYIWGASNQNDVLIWSEIKVTNFDSWIPFDKSILQHSDWVSSVNMFFPEAYKTPSENRCNILNYSNPLIAVSGGFDKKLKVWILGVPKERLTSLEAMAKNAMESQSAIQSSVEQSKRKAQQAIMGTNKEDGEEEINESDRYCLAGTQHVAAISAIEFLERKSQSEEVLDTLIISGDESGMIYLWSINAFRNSKQEAKELVPLKSFTGHSAQSVKCITAYPCDFGMFPVIFSSSKDNIIVWNPDFDETKSMILRKLVGHGVTPTNIEIVPQKKSESRFEPVILSMSVNPLDSDLIIWNFQSKENLKVKRFATTMKGHTENINSVCSFSLATSDGVLHIIATASDDKTVRMFDLQGNMVGILGKSKKSDDRKKGDKKANQDSKNQIHDKRITCVVAYFHDDTQYLLTASEDSSVQKWQIIHQSKNGKFKKTADFPVIGIFDEKQLPKHPDSVNDLVVFNPKRNDGVSTPVVVTACDDRTIRLYEFATCKPVMETDKDKERPKIFKGHTKKVSKVIAFDGYGTREPLIVSSGPQQVLVWRFNSSSAPFSFGEIDESEFHPLLALAPNHSSDSAPTAIMISSPYNRITSWDPWESLTSHKPKRTTAKVEKPILSITCYSNNGLSVAVVGHGDGTLTQLNATTLKPILENKGNQESTEEDDDDDEGVSQDEDGSDDVKCIVTAIVGTSVTCACGRGPSLLLQDLTQVELPSVSNTTDDQVELPSTVEVKPDLENNSATETIEQTKPQKPTENANKLKLIEGRESYVNQFIAFNENKCDKDATTILATCNDRVIRTIDIRTGQTSEVELGLHTKYMHLQTDYINMFHHIDEKDKLTNPPVSPSIYVLIGGGKDFAIFKLKSLSKPNEVLRLIIDPANSESVQITDKSKKHTSIISGLKFFFHKSSPLPYIISTDSEGCIKLWSWDVSEGITWKDECKLADADPKILGSTTAAIATAPKPTQTKEVKEDTVETKEGTEAKVDSAKTARKIPIHSFDIVETLEPVDSRPEICHFIVLGTDSYVPILVRVANANDLESMDFCDYERQFKVDDGNESAQHSSGITSVCAFTHIIEKKNKKRQVMDVITGSKDGKAIIWDVRRRVKKVATILEAGSDSSATVNSITTYRGTDEFPNNKIAADPLIITSSADKSVRVFSSSNGELIRKFYHHIDSVLHASIVHVKDFDPILFSAGQDANLCWIDAFFILNKMFPTHQSVIHDYELDEKNLSEVKDRKKQWARLSQLIEISSPEAFFSENAELFSLSVCNDEAIGFIKLFAPMLPSALLVKQKYLLPAPEDENRTKLSFESSVKVITNTLAKVNLKQAIAVKSTQQTAQETEKGVKNSSQTPTPETDKGAKIKSEIMEKKVVSLLFIAMDKDNKSVIDTIIEAYLNILNRPLISENSVDIYKQYYPFSIHINTSELADLSQKYPAEFIGFINKIELQPANPLFLNDNTDNIKSLKRKLGKDDYELQGLSANYYLVDLWKLSDENETKQWISSIQVPVPNVWKVLNQNESNQWITFASIPFLNIQLFFAKDESSQWVTPMVIPLPHCVEWKVINAYIQACESMDDVTLFDSPVGKYALQFMWETFARKVHVIAFIKHLLYTLLFSLSLFLFNQWTDENNHVLNHDNHNYKRYQLNVFAWILQGISLIVIFYFLFEEFRQLRKENNYNMLEHFSDIWNINDMLIHVSFATGTIIRIAHHGETNISRDVFAVCAIFIYFKILYYLRAFESTGQLVAMIFRIAKDMQMFLIVLFIVLLGFSQSFWILSMQDSQGDSDFAGTSSPELAVVIYVIFTVVVMLLLLNLLIALMGNSYSIVQAKGIAQWRLEQASIIHEQRSITPSSTLDDFNFKKFRPTFIHLLVRTSDLNFKEPNKTEDALDDLRGKIDKIDGKVDKKCDRILKLLK
eukprot:gene10406-13978_t